MALQAPWAILLLNEIIGKSECFRTDYNVILHYSITCHKLDGGLRLAHSLTYWHTFCEVIPVPNVQPSQPWTEMKAFDLYIPDKLHTISRFKFNICDKTRCLSIKSCIHNTCVYLTLPISYTLYLDFFYLNNFIFFGWIFIVRVI